MNYIKSVERIFWPVVQGAFYSEKLKFDDGKECKIVYENEERVNFLNRILK